MSHAKSLAIVKNMASNPKEKAFMAKSIRPNRPPGPFTVEDASQSEIQQEIERQVAKGRVVLACGPFELDIIIEGVSKLTTPEGKEFAASLKQLRKGAFGK